MNSAIGAGFCEQTAFAGLDPARGVRLLLSEFVGENPTAAFTSL
jgi:hypothetical protein